MRFIVAWSTTKKSSGERCAKSKSDKDPQLAELVVRASLVGGKAENPAVGATGRNRPKPDCRHISG